MVEGVQPCKARVQQYSTFNEHPHVHLHVGSCEWMVQKNTRGDGHFHLLLGDTLTYNIIIINTLTFQPCQDCTCFPPGPPSLSIPSFTTLPNQHCSSTSKNNHQQVSKSYIYIYIYVHAVDSLTYVSLFLIVHIIYT